MSKITPFGWKEDEPPDIDATNLELDRAQIGAYAEEQATIAQSNAESASIPAAKLNVASGAAKLGTDATIGGPGGSALSDSVVSDSRGMVAGDLLLFNGSSFVRIAKGSAGQQMMVGSDGTVRYYTPSAIDLRAWGVNGNAEAGEGKKLNEAIAASPEGARLALPEGTILTNEPIVYKSSRIYEGCGTAGSGVGTTIKLANGSNCNVLESEEFTTLSGTNSLGGVHDFEFRDFCVEGNNANQSSGTSHGIANYGFRFSMRNVRVHNTRTDGIHSEWSTSGPSLEGDNRDMEALMYGVKVFGASGAGYNWNGPHDTTFVSCFSIAGGTGSYGFWLREGGGACKFASCHSWGQRTYAWNFASGRHSLVNCEGEGGSKAQVLCNAGEIYWVGGGVFPGGAFEPVGVEVGSGGSNLYFDTHYRECTSGAIKFSGSGQGSTFKGQVSGTGTRVIASGTPHSSVSFQLSCVGGAEDNSPDYPEGRTGTLAGKPNATLVVTENATYAIRFKTPNRPMIVKKIAFGINSASAGNLDLAILNSEGKPLHSLGSTSGQLGSPAQKVIALPEPWELEPNTVYYAAIACSSKPTLVAETVGSFQGAELFNGSVPALEHGIMASNFPIGASTLTLTGTTAVPVLALRES